MSMNIEGESSVMSWFFKHFEAELARINNTVEKFIIKSLVKKEIHGDKVDIKSVIQLKKLQDLINALQEEARGFINVAEEPERRKPPPPRKDD